MGIYLNPGNENFRSITSREIYVDKTQMISVINYFMDTDNKYICMSRPRRFGKTITGNMLAAYYSKGCDSRELFLPYKISKDTDFDDPDGRRNTQNVIKIDLNSEYQNSRDKERLIYLIEEKVKREMRREYPDVDIPEYYSLAEAILEVYAVTGQTFIIIIDEYDVLVREQAERELFDKYLSFLNGLFKSDTLRPAIKLAYLTGILPVVRDKIQSKLNNFREYTFMDSNQLAEYVGFTDEEVQALCDHHGMDYTECRRWYDGYSQRGFEIYNPESVVMAIDQGRYGSYWGKTSTYEAIAERIRQNFEGTKDDVIRMLAGESIEVNITSYMNTMDSFSTRSDLFTYLIHLGYLAFDEQLGTCRIPNWEVRQEWYNALETNPDYADTNKIIEASRELLEATIHGDEEAVARALDVTHIHVTSNRSYNNEDALGSAIYLAYLYALNRYTITREVTAGNGFADVVFTPFVEGYPAMIIELKRNDSAENGLEQIENKRYYEAVSHFKDDLLLVAINYDEKTKQHECRIERFM